MKRWQVILLAAAFTVLLAGNGLAQVLGPCGGGAEKAQTLKMEMKMPHMPMGMMAPVGHNVLLPGDHAVNFSLPAVVGNDIKTIKLSDYAGKWRVVCFYPGDFTFV